MSSDVIFLFEINITKEYNFTADYIRFKETQERSVLVIVPTVTSLSEDPKIHLLVCLLFAKTNVDSRTGSTKSMAA